jgi:hypothetical protein
MAPPTVAIDTGRHTFVAGMNAADLIRGFHDHLLDGFGAVRNRDSGL